MSEIFKPIANESFCNTSANTFGNNKIIRLFNSNTTNSWLITQSNSTVTIATITIGPNQAFTLEKNPTDTFASNTATSVIFSVPVAYKN